MTKIGTAMTAIVAAFSITACTREPAGNADGGSGEAAIASRWNAADACATLGRDAAATAGGATVTDMRIQQISAGGGGLATASSCTVSYGNGTTLMLVVREAPDADATPAAIDAARTGGGLAPPSDPLPGLGKAAFWSDRTGQLQMFADDRRYVAINFFKLPPADDAKARSVAVARALL